MMICPSVLELTTADLAADADLRRHVDECRRCQALLRAFVEDPFELGDEDDALIEIPEAAWGSGADLDAPPRVGAIHTVRAPHVDLLLLGFVAALEGREASVFPLSTEIQLAGSGDVILDADVIGYPVIIESWNPIVVLIEQLAEHLADLSDAAAFGDMSKGARLSEALSETLPQGPPIETEDDPRSLFRTDERKRAQPYAEPARVLSGGDSLGEILRSIRIERDLDSAALADAAGIDYRYLERIEHDSLDLQSEISVRDFYGLLLSLNIASSESFLEAVEDAVCSNDQYVETRTVSRARRFSHARSNVPRASEGERRTRARAWVEKLRSEMARGR